MLSLNTSVPVDPVVASDILKDAIKIVAKTICKPESLCPITFLALSIMGLFHFSSFAGIEEPAAHREVISIGRLSPSVNEKLSSALAVLETKLSVNTSRFYIKFYDVERSFFGFNGSAV